jgi:superfamily II DNA or RNA helicase
VQKVVQREKVLTFKSSKQEIALRAILAEETPLVVVLSTSSGKSLLFITLACLLNSRVTIIVVLFRELIRDLKRRLVEANILATK